MLHFACDGGIEYIHISWFKKEVKIQEIIKHENGLQWDFKKVDNKSGLFDNHDFMERLKEELINSSKF